MNKNIDERILSIRGYRVMLDADLAELYGVTTKRLNEQVKRNKGRFPKDFMFQLTGEEMEILRSQFATSRWGGQRYLPFAFTEHGAVMLASILNSKTATQASIQVVRAFVHFRSIAGAYQELVRRIDKLEETYDENFRVVFAAVKSLLEPEPEEPEEEKEPIGFRVVKS